MLVSKTPIWLIFLMILALGVGSLVAAHYSNTLGALKSVLNGIGGGLVAAVVLGFTVERLLTERNRAKLIRDAVEAGLGYILPEEAKELMRQVYDHKFLCVRHESTITLKDSGTADLVIVANRTIRTFRNISNRPQQFTPSVRYREWFHFGASSRLVDFGASKDNQQWTETQTWAMANSVQVDLATPIALAEGEECTFWYEVEEVRRTTDFYVETLLTPTINPRVTVDREHGAGSPGKLGVATGFGGDAKRMRTDGSTAEFEGMLLAYAQIEVRWWKTDDMREWHDAQKQAGVKIRQS